MPADLGVDDVKHPDGIFFRAMYWFGLFGLVAVEYGAGALNSRHWLTAEESYAPASRLWISVEDMPGAGKSVLMFSALVYFPPICAWALGGLAVGARTVRARILAIVAIVFAALWQWRQVHVLRLETAGDYWPAAIQDAFRTAANWSVGVLGLLLLIALLVLFKRFHLANALMVAGWLVMGSLFLVEIGQLEVALPSESFHEEAVHLTWVPWLAGCLYLAGAGFAALAWWGAANRAKHWESGTARLWRLLREYAQSLRLDRGTPDGPPGYRLRPAYRATLVCGLLGLVTVALVLFILCGPNSSTVLPPGVDLTEYAVPSGWPTGAGS